MDENKITIIDYVEKKLSAEIAELKVLLAKTEFKAFALQISIHTPTRGVTVT